MNKYQYALDNIKTTSNFNIETGEYEWNIFEENDDNIALLQELVDKVPYYKDLEDKATPKKPNIENIDYIVCPTCCSDEIELYDYYGNEVKLKHCNNCGQALDWSNE